MFYSTVLFIEHKAATYCNTKGSKKVGGLSGMVGGGDDNFNLILDEVCSDEPSFSTLAHPGYKVLKKVHHWYQVI